MFNKENLKGEIEAILRQLPFVKIGMVIEKFLRSPFLRENPIVLLDLGCRDVLFSPFDQLGPFVVCHGIDCNEEECKRLRAKPSKFGRKENYYSATLFSATGEFPIYHWKDLKDDGTGWGFYLINEPFSSRFSDTEKWYNASVEMVKTISLDDFIQQNQISDVDFIKSDLEMADVPVMRGGQRAYHKALGVFCEVFFQPRHIKAPLFPQMHQQLTEFGFDFWDLFFWPAHRKARKTFLPTEHGMGQLFDGDALYLKDPIRTGEDLPIEKLIKLAIIADVMYKTDFALEILQFTLEKLNRLP